jgi:quercetin dioxygenase-like cupin family protein
MVVAFNEATIAAQAINPGVARQRLLTPAPTQDISVLFDRLRLSAGASLRFERSPRTLTWLHLLEGEATLEALHYRERISDMHSAFLPASADARLSTEKGTSLLCAEITDSGRLDNGFSTILPTFTVIDWTRAPVIKCTSDARKRVALVNAELCQTATVKIDMVVYPPGTTSSSYFHDDADSLLYILSGRGNAWADEQQFSLRPGDMLCFRPRERHHLTAADESGMRFLAIYTPGKFKTTWVDQTKASTWVSTDLDINGCRAGEHRQYTSGIIPL